MKSGIQVLQMLSPAVNLLLWQLMLLSLISTTTWWTVIAASVDQSSSSPSEANMNLQARPLSSSTVLVQWDQASGTETSSVLGYKIFYTMTPNLPISAWETQVVDNHRVTTISDLQPQQIYTIRVQSLTSHSPGHLSTPVQVKTQQGVPGQPLDLRAVKVTATSVTINWRKSPHSREAITGYEIYWNDTFTQQEYRKSIPPVESFTLMELHPNTVYWIWVAGHSVRGEGAATSPISVKTEQYGKSD